MFQILFQTVPKTKKPHLQVMLNDCISKSQILTQASLLNKSRITEHRLLTVCFCSQKKRQKKRKKRTLLLQPSSPCYVWTIPFRAALNTQPVSQPGVTSSSHCVLSFTNQSRSHNTDGSGRLCQLLGWTLSTFWEFGSTTYLSVVWGSLAQNPHACSYKTIRVITI